MLSTLLLACLVGSGLVRGQAPSGTPCFCTLEYEPFCDPKTGVTYGNRCQATKCGGQVLSDLVPGECETVEEDKPVDPQVCEEEPFVAGNCKASIPRYSFNPDSRNCEQFIYGGCGGTGNSFATETECAETCAPAPPSPNPVPCVCPKIFAPLCNPKTGVTYGNKCEAVECSGQNIDDLVQGSCPDSKPEVAECCTEAEPFCLCSSGPSSPGFCATAEVAAATTCLAAEGATCCKPDVTPTPPFMPCCAPDESCCGDGCIPTVDLPRARCPVNGLCGCTGDPMPEDPAPEDPAPEESPVPEVPAPKDEEEVPVPAPPSVPETSGGRRARKRLLRRWLSIFRKRRQSRRGFRKPVKPLF